MRTDSQVGELLTFTPSSFRIYLMTGNSSNPEGSCAVDIALGGFTYHRNPDGTPDYGTVTIGGTCRKVTAVRTSVSKVHGRPNIVHLTERCEVASMRQEGREPVWFTGRRMFVRASAWERFSGRER